MPKIGIGDAELYYESRGDGPPLLLVPGLGGVGAFWVKQVEEFSRDFRVIVHDHRGTGQSTHARITYSVEQMADDVLKLMDALKIDSAHLVGHSTGGAIGQVLAQDHPRRLRSLVLSATWAGQDAYFRRQFQTRREILLGLGLESYFRSTMLTLMPPAWVSANDAAIDTQVGQMVAAASPTEILVSRIDAIVAFDRRKRLGEIRTPTLVIVADDDVVTPRFYSDELAERIPGAKLAVLDSGGHFAPVISPEPYNRAVGAFLRAQRGR